MIFKLQEGKYNSSLYVTCFDKFVMFIKYFKYLREIISHGRIIFMILLKFEEKKRGEWRGGVARKERRR